MLEINNITKTYGNKKALDDFSMNIAKGEIVGLIGKNGAGKTTILNCLSGSILADEGEIKFNGEVLTADSKIRNTFGFLVDGTFCDYLNAYENLKLLCYASGIKDIKIINKKIDNVLQIVGLENQKKSYVGSFSFGMKQRLSLAQALLNSTNMLILDEPLVGLDSMGRELVKNLIKQKAKEGILVLFSDHNLQEVQSLSDRIVCIDKGVKIYDDVFCEKQEYIINIKQQSNFNPTCISSIISENVVFSENNILVNNKNKLNEVLTCLIQNQIIIDDIVIREDGLIRFFNE
ncbi:MAG: hypothetical protein ATN35_04030 [Epulopiscium sp. Nele67-Bin004]|nr:MAG: hypothetical protein ATN35_04030 [Epulopiscium sp. Nele67-Bin004]